MEQHQLHVLTLVAVRLFNISHLTRILPLYTASQSLRKRELIPENQLTKPCTLYKRIEYTGGPNEVSTWECLLDPADGTAFVEVEGLDLSRAVSSETTLFAEGMAVVDVSAVVPAGSTPVFGQANRRRDRQLQQRSGTIQVVVVRITCGFNQVTRDLATIKSDVFSDPACLKSQLQACSNQRLQVQPGPFDGGIDVSISACSSQVEARNSATAVLQSRLGRHPESIPNTYFMYCIPPNLSEKWAGLAYAFVGGSISVYNDLFCSYVSAQVHEIGHNFNLGHAGEGTDAYGDKTGIMGYSYAVDDEYMCYNAPNMYQLGWLNNVQEFSSRPTGTYTLVGHTNYMGGLQIIRIRGTPSGSDTYIWFNHAAGVHSTTKEAPNQVIVTTRPAGTGYGLSSMMAKLSARGSYTSPSGYYTVQVQSISNGQAVVSFGGTTQVSPPTPAPVTDWWVPAPTSWWVPTPPPGPTPTWAPAPNWWDPVPVPGPTPTWAPIPNWWDPAPPPGPTPTWAPVPNWWDPVPAPGPTPTWAPVPNWWDPAPVTNWWNTESESRASTPVAPASTPVAPASTPVAPAPTPVPPAPTPVPLPACSTFRKSNCPKDRCRWKKNACISL
jgi:Gametolysin peptidase M11